LEREWEEHLAAHEQMEEEYHRFVRAQPRLLSAAEQEAIRRLATDIPGLWDAPTTTVADRKEIIRQVITRIVVDAQGTSERVQVTVDWVGGSQTTEVVIRPVGRLEQLSYYPQLCERLRTLADDGLGVEAIADQLTAEGYRPPKRHERFGRQGVLDLLHRLGVREQRSRSVQRDGLEEDDWWVPTLARRIGMPETTLHQWIRRGWVRAHQQAEPPRRWIVWADGAEVERLCALHQRPAGYATRRLWVGDEELPRDGAGDHETKEVPEPNNVG